MKHLASFAMGVMVVLALGATLAQLSSVDVEQNARLATIEAYLWQTPDKGDDLPPVYLPTPTPEIDTAPTPTLAPVYHRATATATIWIRPSPTSAATDRVFRGQVVDVDPLSCARAGGYWYVRLVAVDLQPRAGWVAAGYLEPEVC